MAKKKEHYGVFIIVGIVIVFAVALVYFGGGNIGQAIKKDVASTITCKFNSEAPQSCWSAREPSWRCEGAGSCSFRTPRVKYGTHTGMESSCGSGEGVRIDGDPKTVTFNCPVTSCMEEAQQMKNKLLEMERIGKTISPSKYEDYEKLLARCRSLQPPAPERPELPVEQRVERPSPPEVPVAEEQLGMVYEQVLCYFKNSGGVIKCVPSGFSDGCQAYSPPVCIADVKGPKGSKISWKSECGVTSTVIDGRVKLAVFECPMQPAVPAPTVPVMLPPEVCRPGMPCPVMPGR